MEDAVINIIGMRGTRNSKGDQEPYKLKIDYSDDNLSIYLYIYI